MVASLLLACTGAGGGGGSDDPDDTGSVAVDEAVVPGVILLSDDDNYAYSGALQAPSFPIAELSDPVIDFSGLTEDLQCHDLDPVGDIDNAELIVFQHLSEDEVALGLEEDSLLQSDVGIYLSQQPGDATSVKLSDFTLFGTDADIETFFTETSGTWLVVLTTGEEIGLGARMLLFLDPLAGETSETAVVDDGCSVLDFSADLTSLDPVTVVPSGPWELDWGELTTTGQGQDFVYSDADGVMVGFYEGLSPADLEGQFLDLELVATELWTMDIPAGTSASLSGLEGFTGFTRTDGTWIFALRCSTCPNPAPLFLTVLEPLGG